LQWVIKWYDYWKDFSRPAVAKKPKSVFAYHEVQAVDCDFSPKRSKTANTTTVTYSAPQVSLQCIRFETNLRQAYKYKLPNRPRNRKTIPNCCFSSIAALDIAFAGPAAIKTTSTQLKTRCLL